MKNFTFQKRSKKMLLRAAERKSSVMPTRNNNCRKSICVTSSPHETSGKNHIFFSVKMLTLGLQVDVDQLGKDGYHFM